LEICSGFWSALLVVARIVNARQQDKRQFFMIDGTGSQGHADCDASRHQMQHVFNVQGIIEPTVLLQRSVE
jgi:hypothetical protein